jgi:hypothetical protein
MKRKITAFALCSATEPCVARNALRSLPKC